MEKQKRGFSKDRKCDWNLMGLFHEEKVRLPEEKGQSLGSIKLLFSLDANFFLFFCDKSDIGYFARL